MSYLEIIRTAVIMFPLFAFLITIPYMLYQYHKYGSIHPYKTLIIFSFALYLEIAYYLVILPLPTITEVASMTTPRTSLHLFAFISDFISDSGLVLADYHTYLNAIKQACFYVPIFNLFLFMPFGIYLHYYFKCSLKKTIILSFLLSLFFELTQLSGLYFIYPRGYRLFDVDDLLINTLGGTLGYYVAYLFMKFLPSKDKIEESALKMGKKVSFIKRCTVFCLDFILYSLLLSIVYMIFSKSFTLIVGIIYYVIMPYFMKGQTLGKKFLNLRVITLDDKKLSIIRILAREVLFGITYFIIPIGLIYITFLLTVKIQLEINIKFLIFIILACILFVYYLIILIKVIRKKILLFELFSHTKLVSTIDEKINKKKRIS